MAKKPSEGQAKLIRKTYMIRTDQDSKIRKRVKDSDNQFSESEIVRRGLDLFLGLNRRRSDLPVGYPSAKEEKKK